MNTPPRPLMVRVTYAGKFGQQPALVPQPIHEAAGRRRVVLRDIGGEVEKISSGA